MDRRTVLAILLLLIVAFLPAIFLKPQPGAEANLNAGDTALAVTPEGKAPGQSPETQPQDRARREPGVSAVPTVPTVPAGQVAETQVGPEDTVFVESPLYRLGFSTRGGRLVVAELKEYNSLLRNGSGFVQLMPENSEFLDYTLLSGGDSVRLGDFPMEPSRERLEVNRAGRTLELRGTRDGVSATLTYTFDPDRYIFRVEASIDGLPSDRGLVLIGLGPRLQSAEADTALDFQTYGIVTKAGKTQNLKFRSLDEGERRDLSGPFEWVAIKSKYFLAAVLTIDEGATRLGGAIAVGGEKSGKFHVNAHVRASLAAPNGTFRHTVYIGPQEADRLSRIGHDLEDVNPYGWIFRPIVRPFAAIVLKVLIWMHDTLNLAYGWALILFGIAVKIVLWPLQQKSMRSSLAMQAIQPDIKALQDRHKGDPQKLQQETMKLYREHGVNPLGGCLPMLLPMPVLFALFFVFGNTIEFRGVPFLWLPDLSAHDPLYIIPVVMGASMFLLSWIGQRGLPPNPQTKMMMYVFPLVLTFMFARFSSGLNLYYAVSNLAGLPQQWLIAEERKKRKRRT